MGLVLWSGIYPTRAPPISTPFRGCTASARLDAGFTEPPHSSSSTPPLPPGTPTLQERRLTLRKLEDGRDTGHQLRFVLIAPTSPDDGDCAISPTMVFGSIRSKKGRGHVREVQHRLPRTFPGDADKGSRCSGRRTSGSRR